MVFFIEINNLSCQDDIDKSMDALLKSQKSKRYGEFEKGFRSIAWMECNSIDLYRCRLCLA